MATSRPSIWALGDLWYPDRPARTALGELVASARAADPDAVQRLAADVAAAAPAHLRGFDAVVAVPPAPGEPLPSLPFALATAVADRFGLDHDATMVRRHHRTAKVRDTDPDRRREVVAAAGYEVTAAAPRVVLVDDVVLTATTVGHIAELLTSAGAAEVAVVVAARARRDPTGSVSSRPDAGR